MIYLNTTEGVGKPDEVICITALLLRVLGEESIQKYESFELSEEDNCYMLFYL